MSSTNDNFWYVYFLRCNDNSLYCGVTKNLQRRLKQHNYTSRGSKYTRSRRPVKLVWSHKVKSRSDALKLEANLKKKTKIQKEKIIETNSVYFIDG